MKISVLFMMFVSSTGCVRYAVNGQQRTAILLQVGVVVRVVNNCAPLLDLERVGGVVRQGLPYGESATVILESTPFTGSNRRMPLTAKGFKADGQTYIGSQTKEFYVNTREGTREEFWEINYLRLPNGRGGCQ